MQSTVNAEVLSAQWQNVLLLDPKDGSDPYLLRFADTRVLPALATLPEPTLWLTLTNNITRWVTIDRSGKLLNLPRAANNSPLADSKPDELSSKNLAHLLRCGQADSVINAIASQVPDLLPVKEHAQFYANVAQACDLAEQFGVDGFPDVVALAIASQLSQGKLMTDSRVLELLKQRTWSAGKLGYALMDFLPEEVL